MTNRSDAALTPRATGSTETTGSTATTDTTGAADTTRAAGTTGATPPADAEFDVLGSPGQITPDLRDALAECWMEVSNAGGAAGFPYPPVGLGDTGPALDRIIGSLDPATSRLITVSRRGELVGWLHLRRDSFALTAHWGTLHHVQTRPGMQGRGYGAALLHAARRVAAEEMGLEQLHLAARAGMGLETFYGRLGWKEIGRWPGALRLAEGDDRDEILMLLDPLRISGPSAAQGVAGG